MNSFIQNYSYKGWVQEKIGYDPIDRGCTASPLPEDVDFQTEPRACLLVSSTTIKLDTAVLRKTG
ncbi:MAG: hypothetical protein LDL41_09735 [Coleofasciculus sp. S288]|nr:hypothetical protein [Coleofasciculus sp. S288]